MRDGVQTATLVSMKRSRETGQEAPMVLNPHDLARLLRQFFTNLRRKRT
jgi:hypothetical protein